MGCVCVIPTHTSQRRGLPVSLPVTIPCLRHVAKSQEMEKKKKHFNRSKIPSLILNVPIKLQEGAPGKGCSSQVDKQTRPNPRGSGLLPLSPSKSLSSNGRQVNPTQAPFMESPEQMPLEAVATGLELPFSAGGAF